MPLVEIRRLRHTGERSGSSPFKLQLKGGEIVPCVAQPSGRRIGQFFVTVQQGHVPQAVLAALTGDEIQGEIHVCAAPGSDLCFLEIGQEITFFYETEDGKLEVPAGTCVDFTL